MTLTELRYIVAVARERHFGRAAEACFVSQPTLSVAIKKLEEELDVKLFERGSIEVSVTPLGDEIVRQAQTVIEQAAGIKEIARRDLEIRGPGEFLGARQSGAALLRFADLNDDLHLLHAARAAAEIMLKEHPEAAERQVLRWLGSKADYLKA